MARTATAAAEFLEDESPRRNMPFRVNAKFLKDPPSGSQVYLSGNFKAEFDTGRPEDQKLGWDDDIPLILNGDSFECIVPDLIVGATYECKFRVVLPDGTEQWFPPGGPESNRKVKIGPETPQSPSPTTGVKEVRSTLKGRVKNILEAARSGDEAQGLEALFDQLRTQMDIMGIRDNQTPLILELAVEVIRENKTFPSAIRAQFPEKQAIPTFVEFQRRMEAGSKNYRRQVFNALKADKAARERFGLQAGASYNPINPLGKPELNRMFDRLCSEKDLSALAPRLGVAIESVANVPSRNAQLDGQRQRLLEDVIARLTPEERREPLKPSKRAKVQEAAVQAALVGIGLVSPPAAIVMWITKGLIEGAAGVHVSDIGTMEPKELGKRLLKNNFVRRWLKTDETIGEITKKGIGDWLKRSIPIFGAKYAGEDLPEKEAETAEKGDPEALIRAACDKAAA